MYASCVTLKCVVIVSEFTTTDWPGPKTLFQMVADFSVGVGNLCIFNLRFHVVPCGIP